MNNECIFYILYCKIFYFQSGCSRKGKKILSCLLRWWDWWEVKNSTIIFQLLKTIQVRISQLFLCDRWCYSLKEKYKHQVYKRRFVSGCLFVKTQNLIRKEKKERNDNNTHTQTHISITYCDPRQSMTQLSHKILSRFRCFFVSRLDLRFKSCPNSY